MASSFAYCPITAMVKKDFKKSMKTGCNNDLEKGRKDVPEADQPSLFERRPCIGNPGRIRPFLIEMCLEEPYVAGGEPSGPIPGSSAPVRGDERVCVFSPSIGRSLSRLRNSLFAGL